MIPHICQTTLYELLYAYYSGTVFVKDPLFLSHLKLWYLVNTESEN